MNTPTTITKQQAFELLSGVRAAVIYGFCIMHDSNDSELAARMRGKKFGFERNGKVEHAVNLTVLSNLIEDRDQRRIIHQNLGLFLKQTLVHRTHEILVMYCEHTSQMDAFKAQPWFQFARIVRNCLAHTNGTSLDRWPKDLTKEGIHKVMWGSCEIRSDQVGTDIVLEPADMIGLTEEMAAFLMTLA